MPCGVLSILLRPAVGPAGRGCVSSLFCVFSSAHCLLSASFPVFASSVGEILCGGTAAVDAVVLSFLPSLSVFHCHPCWSAGEPAPCHCTFCSHGFDAGGDRRAAGRAMGRRCWVWTADKHALFFFVFLCCARLYAYPSFVFSFFHVEPRV